MAYSPTTLLSLPIITTGTESGAWGNITNNGLTQYLDIAIAGSLSLTTDADVNLSNTAGTDTVTNIGSTTAQYMVINCTGSRTVTRNINAPKQSKLYVVINATTGSQSVVLRGGPTSPTTGVTVANGTTALCAWNGSDYVLIGASGNVTLSANNAFTGANTFYNATGQTFGTATAAQDGIILAGRAGGTSTYRVTLQPTTLSANRTLTLPDANTTIPIASQQLTFSGPTAARTYTLPDASVTLLSTNAAVTVPQGGTGATTLTGVLKGNGTSAFSAATAGTDYVAPATATTFTALQTFSGSTSVAATKLTNAKEVATISATAATGTINYDVTTQSVLYYTSNASANWTVNFRGSSGTSLDTLMSTGESMTVAFLVTQGSTAYYNSAVQVDGSSVTPKYQGGTAWSAGNASSIDAYVYTIVKTGSAAFTVFASQTRFA
jgi:hypothetical protein